MSLIHPETVYLRAEESSLPFFQALSSSTRLAIVRLLRDRDLSISEISRQLQLSAAITTRHIKTLESAGIVESRLESGRHGQAKICSLCLREAQVIFNNNYEEKKERAFTCVELPLGSYCQADIQPPCGMAEAEHLFGRIDDPRYFLAPGREDLALIWFTSGSLSWPVPIYDVDFSRLEEVEISLEICSEFPGFNSSFLSDIDFYLNGHLLGRWVSPGDFGDRKGRYTPSWWTLGTEYGLLKTFRITESGVELDGVHLSDRPLSQFYTPETSCFWLRIDCPKDCEHPGGCNIFGTGFGDYEQSIQVKFIYRG